ncbi:lipoyl(octanoyl) transferase LipB [Asticcacaulis benevestitus]|uniref:Octanoyltransferase n=1 Tax=Asticcacaulis benevestitus DSM 16100 = ATCC BAA-896 TaxID=1121022 RepID=V4P8V4_9CAUL|nr:lipoyl(octanoyl) transferase LipB [Asticcacaulis benevestitus]ESQ81660.1 hypothetical protein ABENE_21680 [Asticcacaulis benevestitus DSM 16100 = ATCC BAA-896]
MLSETLNPEENTPPFAKKAGAPPEWVVAPSPVPYPEALAFMEARVAAIHAGEAREMVWLVEHPPLYTAGVSAKREDLIAPDRFKVFDAGRGGQYTYHGPGQRVVYVMLDLNQRQKDVRAFVQALEHWIIDTLWRFNVEGHIRNGRVGVWVERKDKGYEPLTEDKIAAIGIKLRRWVSFHGISLNVEPDLSHFDGIVPCGITEHGVTSLLDLGLPVTMDEVDYALKLSFEALFGLVEEKDLTTDKARMMRKRIDTDRARIS